MAKNKIKVTTGSSNVFQDLGFGKVEAENLRLRSELMLKAEKFMKKNKLTTKKAAVRFGMSQQQMQALLSGKIEKLSLETLVGVFAHAGFRIDVRVKKATRRIAR